MKYKNADLIQQYEDMPKKLREIADKFVELSKENNIEAVVTRILDNVLGDSGVHEQHRGIDFRDQYFDGKSNRALYSMEIVDEIKELLNNQYVRDDGRETVMHHSFESGPFHWHIQIQYKDLTPEEMERFK